MTKSLYHLKPNDSFVIYKANNVFSLSFVSKVLDDYYYDVQFELLVNDIAKRVSVYEFEEGERIYNPEDWFKNPTLYGETRSLNALGEQAIIRRIFDYELKVM